MFLISSCSCFCAINWSQVLSREWRCSWCSADRRCSNYIWVINNFIANWGASYIICFTVVFFTLTKTKIFFIHLTCNENVKFPFLIQGRVEHLSRFVATVVSQGNHLTRIRFRTKRHHQAVSLKIESQVLLKTIHIMNYFSNRFICTILKHLQMQVEHSLYRV